LTISTVAEEARRVAGGRGGGMSQIRDEAPDDIRDLYVRALKQFGEKVHAVGEDQWANATPCSEWDVRALVNHLVNENLWVPPLLEGRTIEEVGDRFDGDQLGTDPNGAWEASADGAVAAVADPDAMQRTVHLSYGDRLAIDYVNEMFIDLAIHGWDLARGIGADEAIDPEFVEVLYARAAPMEDDLKSYGVYGGKVTPPEAADPQTKLLAIFGRVA
jgi:uncharacterized protein (TIGR03086 family)